MRLSITTDYVADRGSPEPYLRRIAEAEFTHVHWCHHWNTDFLYAEVEIEQIAKWLAQYGLALLDLHASVGPEKKWNSAVEYERLAGVELVRNRIAMTRRLGGDVIIMHTGGEAELPAVRRSLDTLAPFAREHGVRIAVENGVFGVLRQLFAEYPPDYLGLCYDCGHGNIVTPTKDRDGRGLDDLETLKDRLISVHLHDNDGTKDQHQLPFLGTVDWPRLARILARSSYRKCVSLEAQKANSGIADEGAFRARAYEVANRFAGMIEKERPSVA